MATRLHLSLLRDIWGMCHPCDHHPAPMTAMFAVWRLGGIVCLDQGEGGARNSTTRRFGRSYCKHNVLQQFRKSKGLKVLASCVIAWWRRARAGRCFVLGVLWTYALSFVMICQYRKKGICPESWQLSGHMPLRGSMFLSLV